MNDATRRQFIVGATAAGVGLTGSLQAPFIRSARAEGVKRVTIASAGPITGNWDPTSHTTIGQWNAEKHMFGHLIKTPVKTEDPYEILPDLAVSWKIIDKFTLEYKLREGVKFHDGKEFGAEDVAATFKYASQKGRPAAPLYPGLSDVEIIDSHTVRVHTEKYGYPAAAFYYVTGFLPILSAKDIANPSMLQQRPNGTGPFMFVETKGDKTLMHAYEGYHEGRPKIDEISYDYVPSSNTRVLGLLNGEYQIIERIEPEQYDSLSTNKSVRVDRRLSLENKYIHFRCNKPPFDDVRIRLAACHAIDRSQVLALVGTGAQEVNAHISPLKFGYTDVKNYVAYDPDKCQQLLSEAGFPGGKGLPEIEYIVSIGFYPKTKEYGELITAMLQAQGFPVKLTVLEPATWEDRIYLKPDGSGAGHMVDVGWMTGSPEPDLVFFPMWHSSGGFFTHFRDKETDAVIEKEHNAATPEERKVIIAKETLPMLAAKMPSFALFASYYFHARSPNLKGVYFFPNGPIDLSKATLA